ncbi:sensor histidine kinase [Cohnella suwonensis]|uniref:Heme sensor protein HssS n=1 Tax=Cohnella suwonensis TaxID=696072 RepID=A0ABW0LRL7_9BACL
MTKSLYVRVVLIFIVVIIVSIAVGFSVSGRLYMSRIKVSFEDELVRTGGEIIRNLETTTPDQVKAYMEQMVIFPAFRVELYDESMTRIYSLDDSEPEFANDKMLETVLNGGIARNNEEHDGPRGILIGLPLRIQDKPYALFLAPKLEGLLAQFRNVLLTVLGIVLFVGSVLILIASRYVVLPLHRLTRATRKLASGDFNVSIRSKRKDEIGQLTNSFNHMAEELGALDRMRVDFVNNVSHEFQSPLTSISGFSKALKSKRMDEDKRNHYLTIIEEESERLSRMGNNLLRLSSLQTGHPTLNPGKFRLDEQLRHVVIACEPQWKAKALRVELELEETTIVADEDLLNQVWTNLFHNAIKFTPESGHIRISLHHGGETASVVIADNGIGIPEEDHALIFTPFYKADKSRDAAVRGNGLGLSIAKRIVDLHNGEIAVFSVAGKGTEFTVSLPLSFAR